MPAPADAARRRPAVGARVGFGFLLAVLAVALLIGSGALDGGGSGTGGRIAALEAQIKCPSCDDLSVAQSSSSTSLAVRQQITRMVRRGDSTQQIKDVLVAEYGPTILLLPPASGLDAAIYLVPALAGAAAVGTLVVLFWRRSRELGRLRRREGDEETAAGPPPSPTGEAVPDGLSAPSAEIGARRGTGSTEESR